jgi:hypothetical protein
MFYKALGFAIWNLGLAYVRRRFARTLKVAAIASVVGVAGLAAAGYLAARSSADS